MRSRQRLGVLLLLLVALAVSACDSTTDAEPASVPADPGMVGEDAELVEVPDVSGMQPDEAQAEIESAGQVSVSFDPEEADDPSLCEVTDQDEVGEVDAGTEVILTIECQVDVPDVTGEMPDDAESAITDAGEDLTVTFDPEPDDPTLCTVADQDVIGEAPPDDGVVLTLECEAEEDGYGYGAPEEEAPDEDGACHPSYPSECLDPDAYDYDCEGGSGDGPEYVVGPIDVDHAVDDPDPFDLDRDQDGTGCQS